MFTEGGFLPVRIRIVDTEDCTCREYNRKHDRVISSKSGKKVMGITASMFCYDPYILAITQSRPFLAKAKDLYDENIDLLIVPHANIPEIDTLISRKSQEGSALILVQPSKKIFDKITDLTCIEYKGEMVSLNEKWRYSLLGTDTYYYPNNLPIQLLYSESLIPLSYVGEYPDLYINGKTAVFASDAFHAYEIYRNQIFTLVKDFSIGWTVALRKVIGENTDEQTIYEMRNSFDLRRDFHSLGLAIYFLEQLAEKLGKGIDTTQVLKLAIESAQKLVDGDVESSLNILKTSFEILFDIRRNLAPLEIFLVESPHNGVLYDDMGFSEFGHPEWSAQFLNDLINLVEKKNYKFNYECEARSILHSAIRLPKTTEKLKNLWSEGKIELVNGTYAQPYPLLYSLESNLRQFEIGLEIFKDVFNSKPKVYQQQEFGFTPQTPQVLSKMGIRHAVHRCFLQGDTPVMISGLFKWKSPNGSEITALSSDKIKTELTGNNFFIRWPDFVLEALEMNLDQVVFTNFSDFGSNPYFREECARIAYYAPVLGEYLTFSEVFKRLRTPNFEKITKMDEYSMMPFPLEGPGRYPNKRAGSHMKVLQNTFKCEHLLLSAEAINAFTNIFYNGPLEDLKDDFRKLMGYESHCVYIVGNSRSYTLLSYYSIPYEGQITDLTYEDRGGDDLLNAENHAKAVIESEMKIVTNSIVKQSTDQTILTGFIFNPLSYSYSKVIEIPYEGNESVTVKNSLGQILPTQRGKNKLLFQIELPPLGIESFSVSNGGFSDGIKCASKVEVSNSSSSIRMENENFTVEIDKNTGCISQIFAKNQSYNLFKDKGLNFIIGSYSDIKTIPIEIEVLEVGPIRAKATITGILLKERQIVGSFRMTVSLESGSELIPFEVHFDTLDPVVGIPWLETLRVRFDTNLDNPTAYRVYLNVIEKTAKKLYNSPYFTLLSNEEKSICFMNDGPQFYILDNNTLEFVLTGEQDYTRDFRWAIYLGREYPLRKSLSWQYPTIIKVTDGVLMSSLLVKKSLLKSSEDNILITGAIPVEDRRFRFHIYEISGKKTTFTLHSDAILSSVEIVDSENNTDLQLKENQITLSLNPWEFVTLEVTFQDCSLSEIPLDNFRG